MTEFKEVVDIYPKIKKNYTAAIREIRTKLQNLDDDFQSRHKHNPIHYMESRIKSPESIFEKITRKGYEFNINKISNHIFDIGGIRVICHYVEDIYTIANLLKKQDDISLIKEVDYIKEPKPNGYRSLHLVLEIPVFFVDRVEKIRVEVQIRTIAMDFWASLEHKLKYKKDLDNAEQIAAELRVCADSIEALDYQMQELRDKIDRNERNYAATGAGY